VVPRLAKCRLAVARVAGDMSSESGGEPAFVRSLVWLAPRVPSVNRSKY
jgi:hypothetical protein